MKLHSNSGAGARMGQLARRTRWRAGALALCAVLMPAPSAAAAALKAIHNFAGPPSDGANPTGLVLGSEGVLYGATFSTIFSLRPPTSPGGVWTETTLYNFTGGSDGLLPVGLVVGNGGVLYGFTAEGGNQANTCSDGCGTLFSVAPPSSPGDPWTKTTLFNFTGGSDGSLPDSLILHDGILYGTASSGGNEEGLIYSLTPPANPSAAWTQTVLYAFPFGGGGIPVGIVMGADGVLYGTITNALSSNNGGVFSLTPPASAGGTWTYAPLYTFAGGSDASLPTILTIGGNSGGHPILYGASRQGGDVTASCSLGCGAIFTLAPPASPDGVWTEAVLYRFTGGDDGDLPNAGVTIGSGGVIYAAASEGGLGTATQRGTGYGSLISLTPPLAPGGAWTPTVLADFNFTNGARPQTSVVVGSGGTIYGNASNGGAFKLGTVYKLKP